MFYAIGRMIINKTDFKFIGQKNNMSKTVTIGKMLPFWTTFNNMYKKTQDINHSYPEPLSLSK